MNLTEIIQSFSPNFGNTFTPGLSGNFSILDVLPTEIVSNLNVTMTIIKAAGIVFIIYMVFLIIKGILSFRRGVKISRIYRQVEEIDKKIDVLLAQEKIRVRKQKFVLREDEKRGFFSRLFNPIKKRRLVVMSKLLKKDKTKSKKK